MRAQISSSCMEKAFLWYVCMILYNTLYTHPTHSTFIYRVWLELFSISKIEATKQREKEQVTLSIHSWYFLLCYIITEPKVTNLIRVLLHCSVHSAVLFAMSSFNFLYHAYMLHTYASTKKNYQPPPNTDIYIYSIPQD